MKGLITLFSVIFLTSPILCTPPKMTQRKSKSTKALKLNCIKAREDAKKRNKNRKKSEWPPDSL